MASDFRLCNERNVKKLNLVGYENTYCGPREDLPFWRPSGLSGASGNCLCHKSVYIFEGNTQ